MELCALLGEREFPGLLAQSQRMNFPKVALLVFHNFTITRYTEITPRRCYNRNNWPDFPRCRFPSSTMFSITRNSAGFPGAEATAFFGSGPLLSPKLADTLLIFHNPIATRFTKNHEQEDAAQYSKCNTDGHYKPFAVWHDVDLFIRFIHLFVSDN